jgi:hypothetical protein
MKEVCDGTRQFPTVRVQQGGGHFVSAELDLQAMEEGELLIQGIKAVY